MPALMTFLKRLISGRGRSAASISCSLGGFLAAGDLDGAGKLFTPLASVSPEKYAERVLLKIDNTVLREGAVWLAFMLKTLEDIPPQLRSAVLRIVKASEKSQSTVEVAEILGTLSAMMAFFGRFYDVIRKRSCADKLGRLADGLVESLPDEH